MAEGQRDGEGIPEQVTSEIFTAANVVSFVRLCLVPVYLWLLLSGFNLAATLVFAAAAASDFIDGQLARRTHTVSKLGQILDPAVDRILMITGVLGVFLVGRIPLWVIVVVVLRDAYLLIGGAWLLSRSSALPGFSSMRRSSPVWAGATSPGCPGSTARPSPGASGSSTRGSSCLLASLSTTPWRRRAPWPPS